MKQGMSKISVTNIKTIIILGLVMTFLSCIEEFTPPISVFEDVLVINALLTDELKHQEIQLTRSFRFEESDASTEDNAEVSVTDSSGNEYLFDQDKSGKYISTQAFASVPNVDYQLFITTESGKKYASTAMQLPQNTSLDDVSVNRTTNNNGVEGMAIYVDSYNPDGTSRYYRYAYDETYKIIAPQWTPYDLVVRFEGFSQIGVDVILREREEQVCYGNDPSREIILNSTINLAEDKVDDFEVRFIARDNYILTYRYSILVKQYVLSQESFAYYETLKGLTQSENTVFSEDQPGFLEGNVFSVENPDENVAGFFEVSGVNEKRIFFNYEDYFPEEPLPPYAISCNTTVAPNAEGPRGNRPLLEAIYADQIRFFDYNTNPQPGEGSYLTVFAKCGDCTTLGSNVVPAFWEE